MLTKSILVKMDEKMFEDIHNLMDYALKNDDDLILFRIFEGESKQQWYRELLRAGMEAKNIRFAEKKKGLEEEEDEDKSSH